MPRFFVVGLIISLAVALIAAAKNSTDSAEAITELVEPEETSTENPDEGSNQYHRRPTGKCGDNETWKKCGKACEKTCKRREGCLVKICGRQWDGCRCKLGYVRNRKGKCVRPRQCNMCNSSKK